MQPRGYFIGLFDIFKKKFKMTEELKLNKIWDLWVEGKEESPYTISFPFYGCKLLTI